MLDIFGLLLEHDVRREQPPCTVSVLGFAGFRFPGFRVSGFGSRDPGFEHDIRREQLPCTVPALRFSSLGFQVSTFAIRVSGFEFQVSGSGFRVSSPRFRKQPPCTVSVLGFSMHDHKEQDGGSGFGAWGQGVGVKQQVKWLVQRVWVSGLGFRVSGLRFEVSGSERVVSSTEALAPEVAHSMLGHDLLVLCVLVRERPVVACRVWFVLCVYLDFYFFVFRFQILFYFEPRTPNPRQLSKLLSSVNGLQTPWAR